MNHLIKTNANYKTLKWRPRPRPRESKVCSSRLDGITSMSKGKLATAPRFASWHWAYDVDHFGKGEFGVWTHWRSSSTRAVCIEHRLTDKSFDARVVRAKHKTPSKHVLRSIVSPMLCICIGQNIQQIWANAHETRHSISIISYAGCLGQSPAKSAKIRSLSVRRSLKWQKIH